MSTTFERFQGATLSLARSGHIKERLIDAYRNHIALIAEEELPSELRDEFRALSDTLTRERPLLRGEDSARATVRKLSCEEADEIASRVVGLFVLLSKTQAAGARGKVPKSTPHVVPLYLAEA
jgi:hypothetical protein